jgi:ribosomal-protein-serine acetyltransferase
MAGIMFRLTIREDLDMRLLEERHAPQVFDVVDKNRVYLREWLPWVDPTVEIADTAAFIKSSLEQFARNEGFVAGIWCVDQLAGTIGFHKIDWLNRKVEMGYWLAEAFQGRGIVTDACRAAIGYAFREWKLNRVEIHCATGNAKSCAIAKRLGFQLEGTLREAGLVNGRYLDHLVWSVLAREWR